MTGIAIVEPYAVVFSVAKSPKLEPSNSAYMFHPISPEREPLPVVTQEEMSCISLDASSDVSIDNVDEIDDMDFTPYPFTATEKELDDWQGLELSFGHNWSLTLADHFSEASTTRNIDSWDSDSSSIASVEVSFFIGGDGWCDKTPRDCIDVPVST